MPKRQLIEHFHVSFFVLAISANQERAVRRALNGDRFRSRLQAAVRQLVSRNSAMRQSVSRSLADDAHPASSSFLIYSHFS